MNACELAKRAKHRYGYPVLLRIISCMCLIGVDLIVKQDSQSIRVFAVSNGKNHHVYESDSRFGHSYAECLQDWRLC